MEKLVVTVRRQHTTTYIRFLFRPYVTVRIHERLKSRAQRFATDVKAT